MSISYGKIPGHIPEKVKITSWSNNTINRNWFDLSAEHATSDWAKLSLPAKQVLLGEMSAPKKGVKLEKGSRKKEVIIDNKPVKVKLASASQNYMYQGGKKECVHVLLPQGYVVDMHADVLFEALMRDGFDETTKELKSEFIIATIRGTARLIRVDSDLHKLCLAKMKLDNKPKLDVKTMSVGQVYETKAGTPGLFLGFVTTRYLKSSGGRQGTFSLRYSTMKMATLWLDLEYYDLGSSKKLQANFNKNLRGEGQFWYGVSFKPKAGHGFVSRNTSLNVDVPVDIIRLARLHAIKSANQTLNQMGNADCDKYQAWIDKGCPQAYGYNSYGSHGRPNTEFHPPGAWQIHDLIHQTKRTNMTVFGMTAEPSPSSRKVEKLVELFNKQHGYTRRQ